ncbi:MAG: putative toxin-antitoxin system toxin component, PIN family [Caldilineaceae bacterium]|nr:putative toxin-antitoxin system toxin component, PIN family [Caldilineaceae bacterium]
MSNHRSPKVFLDTSVLIAAIFSATGGAREILRLGEIGAIQIVVSQDVVVELEENILKKRPQALAVIALVLDNSAVTLVEPPSIGTVQRCQHFLSYADDAVVLAAALDAQVDCFVTLDRQHFLKNSLVPATLPLLMGTPSDFLAWYRNQYG